MLAERKEVTEGAFSAAAIVSLAKRLGVHMPIAEAVDSVLNHGAYVDEMIATLLPHPRHVEMALP